MGASGEDSSPLMSGRRWVGASWRPGCPVDPAQLPRVEVDHLGFDGQTHRGELIVNQDLAPEVITVFALLYHLGFPIEKIRTADQYPAADDELSMQDNSTSAFNCRASREAITGLNTPLAALSTSIHVSTPASTPPAPSSRKTRRTTWTAARRCPDSYTTGTPSCAPSRIAGGGGAVTGRRPSIISISSGPEPRLCKNARICRAHSTSRPSHPQVSNKSMPRSVAKTIGWPASPMPPTSRWIRWW